MDWFLFKVSNIRQFIPVQNSINFDACKKIMNGKNAKFEFKDVNENDIRKILKSLKSSKSTGVDELDSFSLKIAADIIYKPIAYIIKLSIKQGKVPTLWKYSKVLPLFKKEDRLSKKNYRPVANLSPISKILERWIHEQLYKYFEDNELLHRNHHGFRKSRSTLTALLQLYERWVKSSENGELTGIILVDLSAAFDLVDPAILCQKLKIYGLDESSIKWFQNYLSEREQFVSVHGTESRKS